MHVQQPATARIRWTCCSQMNSSATPQLILGLLIAAAMLVISYQTMSPMMLFGVAFIPIIVWVVLELPFLPALTFAILSATRLHEAYPGAESLRPALAAGFLMTLAAIWHLGLRRTLKPYYAPELKWLSLLTVFIVLGLITSFSRANTLSAITDLWLKLYLTVLLIAWLTRTGFELRVNCTAMVASAALISFSALQVVGQRTELGTAERAALTGMIGDPNDLTLSLIPPLALSVAYIYTRTNYALAVLGLVTATLVMVVALHAMSRGSLLSIAAMLLVVGYLLGRWKAVVTLGILSSPMLVLIAMRLMLRSDLVASGPLGDDSSQDRLHAWYAALKMGFSNPLWGVGHGNFFDAFHAYADRWENYRNMAVHSTWLECFAQLGFPGLIAFVIMIYFAFRSLLESKRILEEVNGCRELHAITIGLIGGLAGYCVGATFLTQFVGWMLYIVVAFSVALRRHLAEAYPDASAAAGRSGGRAKRHPSPAPAGIWASPPPRG